MVNWTDLDKEAQLRLRLDYQAVLDREPRTCDLDEKTARFTAWLAARGVAFGGENLIRPRGVA